jgi:hypothetical protein
MEQNQPLELTEEVKRELSVGLLREWWVTASQALEDKVGVEEALILLRKGFSHHGAAGSQIAANFLSMDPCDPLTFAYSDVMAKRSGTGGSVSVEIRGDGRYLVIEDCRTGGESRVACKCFCAIAAELFWKEMDPEIEIDWLNSKANGDLSCRVAIKRRGAPPPVGEVLKVVRDMDVPLSEEDWEFFSKATVGENWAIVIRALADRLGDQGTIDLMEPYMRNSGLAFSLKWSQGSRLACVQDRILAAVVTVHESFDMKLPAAGESEELGSIVTECPFSGSSSLICHQFEAFFNGICEAIDPSYEFAYDRMMTKGDKTCHWTIRKKDDRNKSLMESASATDPIAILKLRYAKGEITDDQYDKMLGRLIDRR